MKCLLTISLLLCSWFLQAAPSICSKEPLACNVYFEARGEKERGQYAVAFVSMNRLKNGNYGNTMREVVFKKGQFSWTKKPGKIANKEAWAKARKVAADVTKWSKEPVLYRKKDITKGALYFHGLGVYLPKVFPPKRLVARIGNHLFYT